MKTTLPSRAGVATFSRRSGEECRGAGVNARAAYRNRVRSLSWNSRRSSPSSGAARHDRPGSRGPRDLDVDGRGEPARAAARPVPERDRRRAVPRSRPSCGPCFSLWAQTLRPALPDPPAQRPELAAKLQEIADRPDEMREVSVPMASLIQIVMYCAAALMMLVTSLMTRSPCAPSWRRSPPVASLARVCWEEAESRLMARHDTPEATVRQTASRPLC